MTEQPSFAGQLDSLFRRFKRPDGKEYSSEAVAAAINANGVSISGSYIWALRKGKKTNPTVIHAQAIADFFGVPPTYFFNIEAAARIDQRIDELRAEQARLTELTPTGAAQLVALRTSELDPPRQKLILDMLAAVEAAQRAERGGDSNG